MANEELQSLRSNLPEEATVKPTCDVVVACQPEHVIPARTALLLTLIDPDIS